MAKDFRTNQIRFSKLIASGNISGATPNLGVMIYRSSKASNFEGGQTVNSSNLAATAGIGTDVWMLVDGTPNIAPSAAGPFADDSTVLFLGNVAVSGTLRAQRSTVEVSNTVPSGRFVAARDMAVGDGAAIGAVSAANKAGVGLVIDNANRVFAFDVLTGSSSGSNLPSKTTLSFPHYPGTTVGARHADVNFHVGGIKGSRGNSNNLRGTALFDGDLVVSGNLKTHGTFSFTPQFDVDVVLDNSTGVPPAIQFQNGGTAFGRVKADGQALRVEAVGAASAIVFETNADHGSNNKLVSINQDGNIGLDGGSIHFISHSSGVTVGSIGVAASNEIMTINLAQGDLSITNGGTSQTQVVKPTVPIEFPVYSALKSAGQAKGLRFEGPASPKAPGSINALRFTVNGTSGSNETALVLTSSDSSIRIQSQGTGANGKIILSASAGVEITSPLTVTGPMVQVQTTNTYIKDQIILLASGAIDTNTNGGIAIKQGSSTGMKDLVWGRVANDTWGAGMKNTSNAEVTDLTDMELLNIRAIKYEINGSGNDTISGANVGGSPRFVMSASNSFAFETTHPIYLDDNALVLIQANGNSSARGVRLRSPKGRVSIQSATGENPRASWDRGDGSDTHYTWISKKSYTRREYRGDSLQYFMVDGKNHHVSITSVTDGASSTNQNKSSRVELNAQRGVFTGLPNSEHTFILSQSDAAPTDSINEPTGFAMLGGLSDKAHGVRTSWLLTGSNQKDTAFFVSGAIGCVGKQSTDRDIRGAAVFGGDLVVSGNFYPGGGVLKVQAVRVNPLDHGAAPGYLRFGTDAGGDEASFEIARDSGHLKFKDTQSPNGGTGYTLTQLAALATTDNTDAFAVTHQNGSSPFLSYIATTGSFSFDHNPRTNGYSARRTNQIGDDVYFFVSGSANNSGEDWDGAWRGAAVFGGDVVTSGSVITNTLKVEVEGNGAKISQRSGAGDIKFFVDKAGAGTQVEAMRLTNGGANIQLGADSNSDAKLAFALEANAYIQFINGGGSPNTLKIVTDENADDKIQLTTGTGDTAAAGGTIEVRGDVVPTANNEFNLGSSSNRWANVYTGDLHLRNERGDWTIVEESDYLCVVNNLTGKKYKMMLEPIGDDE